MCFYYIYTLHISEIFPYTSQELNIQLTVCSICQHPPQCWSQGKKIKSCMARAPDIFQVLYAPSPLTGKVWQGRDSKVILNEKYATAKDHKSMKRQKWNLNLRLFQFKIYLGLLLFGLLFFPVCAHAADQGCLGSICPLQMCFSVGHGTQGFSYANHINSVSQWDDWQFQSLQARWKFALFNSELFRSCPHQSWSCRSPCLSCDDQQPLGDSGVFLVHEVAVSD